MKVIYFLQWWWKKLDTWQKFWIIASYFFGVGLASDGPYKVYLVSILPAFVLLTMIKWLFWDNVKNAWLEFNKEQEHIIKIMKGSK